MNRGTWYLSTGNILEKIPGKIKHGPKPSPTGLPQPQNNVDYTNIHTSALKT
jgi:hypothetical protein